MELSKAGELESEDRDIGGDWILVPRYHSYDMNPFEYDAFISHASEDKSAFVEPLARELQRWGLNIWFDKFSLRVGDSLRDSIESGLAKSQFGIVVFSPSFLAKNWPKAELNGLFSKEMDNGRNVILPIWHEIGSAEMRAAFPIQSDKVALRSSDGVEVVAKSLVERIRPELFEIEKRKLIAFDANSSFIETAKSKYPGYEFSLRSGDADRSVSPGVLSVVNIGSNRIDVRISDPSKLHEKPHLRLALTKEGSEKVSEFLRTGKPQTWGPGEVQRVSGSIPFVSPLTFGPGLTMAAKQTPRDSLAKFVRLEVGDENPVRFAVMEMQLVRLGTEEGQIRFSHKLSALEVSLAFFNKDVRQGAGVAGLDLSCSFDGHTFKECEKAIEAVDRIRKGERFRILDIEEEKVAFEGPAREFSTREDNFPIEVRSFVSLCAQVERRFGVRLYYPANISDEDDRSLFYFDCLLNGREFADSISTESIMQKGDGETLEGQRRFFGGEEMIQFLEPAANEGFPLFGRLVRVPPWGIYAFVRPSGDAPIGLPEFDEAQVGAELPLKVVSTRPVQLRWKSEIAP
ncbi:MAG TPA: toll/interleukin-1 receptor domain-containing protein [Terracidiphilus sp.]|jgi:hypothetical protein|nr:toll/interleukin-1 receptor domain-containing protein [Terracidiphilus sp.]